MTEPLARPADSDNPVGNPPRRRKRRVLRAVGYWVDIAILPSYVPP